MKKFYIILTLIIISSFSIIAHDNSIINDIYKEQVKISGADSIIDEVPKDAKESLENIGVCNIDWNILSELNANKILDEIIDIARKQSYNPLKSITAVISIMLLYSLLDGLKVSFGEKSVSNLMNAVSTLSVCIVIILPIVKCIKHSSNIINSSAKFMMCYIPVMTGLLVSSGQVASGTSYYYLMVGIGEMIIQLSSDILSRMLCIFLALSVVSSISPKLNMSSMCDFINQGVKWVLGFVMSIFTSLLTIKTIIGTSADNISTKTAKLFLNNLVPIVGGALSDAFTTVQSCVKLLKSGIGAFAIIAVGFIFIPVILECLVWVLCLSLCVSIGDVLGISQLTSVVKAASKVVNTMLVITISCLTILIISTVIILVVGGGAS